MTKDKALRVLVVEDDFLIRMEISSLLEGLGFKEAGRASTGAEAVELACSLGPDVVLMDIEMPKMNGLEAAALIHERCPRPVVILTAYESEELIKKAAGAGVGAYLTKPPSAAELERAIAIAIARHKDIVTLRKLNAELSKALDEIKTLRGILPCCSFCKKIRDDKGFWEKVDVYIRDHSEAKVSHGICPECMKIHYPDIDVD